MAISNRYSSMARPDLIITEYRFLIHSMQRTSENSSKSLIAIQWSDQKLWPFRTVTQAWRDQTSKITEYPILMHSVEKGIRKLQKEFERDPTVGSKVMPISNRY